MTDKTADLAGPGIGDYGELAKELPKDYEALLGPMDRMKAVFAVKNYIEANLCKQLNLQMVQVPLIVDKDSGVNDYLDRDGSRTPVEVSVHFDAKSTQDRQVKPSFFLPTQLSMCEAPPELPLTR